MAGESKQIAKEQYRWPAKVRNGQRLLALDLRNRKAGFVVIERPMKLLDWGVRTFGRKPYDPADVAMSRIERLLYYHSPRVVVVRESRFSRRIVQRFRAGIRNRRIGPTIFSAGEVRRVFAKRGCRNKHETALYIVQLFDDLAWKLPPRRKLWQSENHTATIFDAAAVALTFLSVERNESTRRLRGLSS